MNQVREIARATRRGLFGDKVPARAWQQAIENFQNARESLSRAALELESTPPATDDPALARAWADAFDAIERQSANMDGAATGILAVANIANGVENFFPGFNGVTAANVFGLDNVAAPSTIAVMRAMTNAAQRAVARAHMLLGKPATRPGLSGFTPWGSIGGDVWEWLHAEQVQREYEAVGQEPPTIEEIREGALFDIGERVSEKAEAFAGYTRTIMIAGAVIAVVVFMGGRK